MSNLAMVTGKRARSLSNVCTFSSMQPAHVAVAVCNTPAMVAVSIHNVRTVKPEFLTIVQASRRTFVRVKHTIIKTTLYECTKILRNHNFCCTKRKKNADGSVSGLQFGVIQNNSFHSHSMYAVIDTGKCFVFA